jgi:hypothetical protein
MDELVSDRRLEQSMIRTCAIALLAVLCTHAPAFAQRDRLLVEPSPPPHWAVTFSFTPEWDVYPYALAELANIDRREIRRPEGGSSLQGSDWSLGFARGRALGGDWGVSFARQSIRKESVIDRTYGLMGEHPCFPDRCSFGERLVFQDVAVIGPEVHLYVPFFTVKERVQVGLLMAGGWAKFTGNAVVDRFEQDFTVAPTPPNSQFPIVRTQVQGPIGEITDRIYYDQIDWTVTARLQPGVSVILSPQVKVHVSSGYHYPGTTYFALRATYFFPRAAP